MLKIKLNWVIAFCKIIAVMFYIRVKKIRVYYFQTQMLLFFAFNIQSLKKTRLHTFTKAKIRKKTAVIVIYRIVFRQLSADIEKKITRLKP